MATVLTNVIEANTTTNSALFNQLCDKEDQCNTLNKHNQQLAKEITALTKQLSRKEWEAFTSKPTLLIGDSLIKNIDETKMNKTVVNSLPDAKVNTKYINNDDDHYRQIV